MWVLLPQGEMDKNYINCKEKEIELENDPSWWVVPQHQNRINFLKHGTKHTVGDFYLQINANYTIDW